MRTFFVYGEKMKTAFTMIELIFVIVILGILAAIAIPKQIATRDDAKVAAMARSISISANEIAMYAISQGSITEGDLASMSNVLDGLDGTGKVTLGNMSVSFKMGEVDDCVTFAIDDGAFDANLTLDLAATGDDLCQALQGFFDPSEYPIPLKGVRVVR